MQYSLSVLVSGVAFNADENRLGRAHTEMNLIRLLLTRRDSLIQGIWKVCGCAHPWQPFSEILEAAREQTPELQNIFISGQK